MAMPTVQYYRIRWICWERAPCHFGDGWRGVVVPPPDWVRYRWGREPIFVFDCVVTLFLWTVWSHEDIIICIKTNTQSYTAIRSFIIMCTNGIIKIHKHTHIHTILLPFRPTLKNFSSMVARANHYVDTPENISRTILPMTYPHWFRANHCLPLVRTLKKSGEMQPRRRRMIRIVSKRGWIILISKRYTCMMTRRRGRIRCLVGLLCNNLLSRENTFAAEHDGRILHH